MTDDTQHEAPERDDARLQMVERDAFESVEVGLTGHELQEAREALDFIREEYASLKEKVATLRKNWPADPAPPEQDVEEERPDCPECHRHMQAGHFEGDPIWYCDEGHPSIWHRPRNAAGLIEDLEQWAEDADEIAVKHSTHADRFREAARRFRSEVQGGGEERHLIGWQALVGWEEHDEPPDTPIWSGVYRTKEGALKASQLVAPVFRITPTEAALDATRPQEPEDDPGPEEGSDG